VRFWPRTDWRIPDEHRRATRDGAQIRDPA
jgi:hypothetical protein